MSTTDTKEGMTNSQEIESIPNEHDKYITVTIDDQEIERVIKSIPNELDKNIVTGLWFQFKLLLGENMLLKGRLSAKDNILAQQNLLLLTHTNLIDELKKANKRLESENEKLQQSIRDLSKRLDNLELMFDSREVCAAIEKVILEKELGQTKGSLNDIRDEQKKTEFQPFRLFLTDAREPANSFSHARPQDSQTALQILLKVDLPTSVVVDDIEKVFISSLILKHEHAIIQKVDDLKADNVKRQMRREALIKAASKT